MARTTINSLGIPADTIVSADLDYPLTDFSSTGIDDNASSTSLTIDSSGNITVTGTVDGRDLATDGTKLDGIAASATNYGDSDVATYISGNRSYGNITTTGYIAGPSTFTIDPAAVGDNTGTLVIAGNLQVDGTTTTINSTTVNVDDLNIQLATGAVNAAAADGAGITVDGPTVPAKITYNSTPDEWTFNKNVRINISTSTSAINELSFTNAFDTAFLRSSYTNPSSTTETYLAFHTNTSGTTNGTVAEQMRIAGNKVGIGTGNTFTTGAKFEVNDSSSNSGFWVGSGSVVVTRQSGFPNIFWDDGTDNLGAIYYDKTNGMRIYSTDGSTGNPERLRINTSGQLIIQGNSDTSMSAAANGQFQVSGNAYSGAIALDGTAMYLYHNSASRALVLATNESAQLTLLASGDVQVNRGKIYVHDSAGSTTNSLKLSYNATNGGAVIGPDSNGGSTYLTIGTSNSGTFAERMYISSTGNVGISDGNPQEKLSVVGGILAASSSGSTSGITIESTATAGYVSTISHTDTGMEFDTGSIIRHFKFDGAGTNLWTLYTNTGNIEQNYGVYRFAATTSGSDTGSQFQLWGTNGGPGYMAAYNLNFNTGNNNARTTAMKIDQNGNVGINTSSNTSARLTMNTPQYTASATGGMIKWHNTNVSSHACIQGYYVAAAGAELFIGTNAYINTAGTTVTWNSSYASSAIYPRRDGSVQFFAAGSGSNPTLRYIIEGTDGSHKYYNNGVSGSAVARKYFYHHVTFSTGGYVHMKTNISWASHTQMYSIHFEGQEYQASRAIDTTLSWYSYSPNNAAINVGSYGTHTASVYSSSDGYLVMVWYANSSTYYSAFTLSQRTTAQGINTGFAVTNSTVTNSATGAF